MTTLPGRLYGRLGARYVVLFGGFEGGVGACWSARGTVGLFRLYAGDAILLTEATRSLLPDPDRRGLEPCGKVPLRGKSEPLPVYAVDTRMDERPIPQKGHIKAGA